MAQATPPSRAPNSRYTADGPNPWAASGTVFAAVLMLVEGVIGILKGIVGIANDDVYASVGDYTFKFDVTAWGWIHLVLGIVLVVVGAGILKGADWARVTGVVIVALDIILNFLWLPYTPLWGLISIAIGIFIIWALCTEKGSRSPVS
ncbi:hypothetical protein ABT024_15700 [Streptomyces sp. NPDC002812]|uniref:DUF7144 family membrane protein n=1 Tax=unclassified Streptomyces TaxID=2593676 RepID=UPI002030EBB4|nr:MULTISPECIES: hypothetical protein [unclassified Streptomyces]MCM1969354.1 hypothetical protein [Streptomyces sp. G1]MCX5127255.1 hypothetical protein [Streptomyces sp. NBC_00347]MCX5295312.1 hypothetical protein [Streptomyces sp. NBC_00193]